MPDKHHKYSPSKLEMYSQCPGASLFDQSDDVINEAAERGTLLHAIMAGELDRADVELRDDEEDVLDEMARHVELFTGGEPYEVEQRIEFIEDDFSILTAGIMDVNQVLDDRVKIMDYKSGYIWVPPDSLQVKTYALLAMRKFNKPVAEVAISQPRAGGLKPAMFTDYDALYAEVKGAITACHAENPVFKSGEYCKFCSHRFNCSVRLANEDKMFAVAKQGVTTISNDVIGRMASQAKIHKKVCEQIEKECKRRTLAGEPTGWKVIEKQGRASISDPVQAVARVGSVLPQEEIVSGAVSLSLSKLKQMYANKLKESGLKTKKEAEKELENLLADVITRGKPTQTMVEDKGKTK